MSATVVCPRQPLPRELDVTVNISRPITEIATDMTLLCFLTPDAPFSTDQGRVRYYSTIQAVEADFAVGSSTWFAASAFFSQMSRPTTMAIGAVFTSPTGARLYSGDMSFSQLKTASQGAFDISVGGNTYQFRDLNFSAVNTITDVVTLLQAAFTAQNVPATIESWGDNGLLIVTNDTGANAQLNFATVPSLSSGTPTIPATYTTYTGGTVLGNNLPQAFYSALQSGYVTTGTKYFAGTIIQANGVSYKTTGFALTNTIISTSANLISAINNHFRSINAPATITLSASGRVTISCTISGPNTNFALLAADGTDYIDLTPSATSTVGAFGLSSSTGGVKTIGTAEIPGTSPETSVADELGLTLASNAKITAGTVPESLVQEAVNVDTASRCNGRPIYGWVLDAQYRETQAAQDFAGWVEGRIAIFSACTNSAYAYDPGSTTDFGAVVRNEGYIRTCTMYHDNPQVYPDVSYLAYLLATNYAQPDSAITMKFKQLPGIATSRMTETMLSVLNNKRINCYTQMGTTSMTVREGVQAADTWFSDTLVNMDNFREELQVAIYNVFLRNKKVPYTSAGQNLLISAVMQICRRYTLNGVFADRSVEDSSSELGFIVYPATDIVASNIALATSSERAQRLAPPIHIVAYEAGAFHRITVNVDVYN